MTAPHVLVKNVLIGQTVKLKEPDGIGIIRAKSRSSLFQASGGCYKLDVEIVSGPNKGEWIRDQHYPGDDGLEIPEEEATCQSK